MALQTAIQILVLFQNAIEEGDIHKARAIGQRLVEFNQARPEAYRIIGNGFRQSRFFDEGEHFLKLGCDRFPDNAILAADYARAALEHNDYEISMLRWISMISRFPDDVSAYVGAAMTMRLSGNLPGAMHFVERAIVLFPNDLKPQIERARLASARGEFQNAILRWKALRTVSPHHPMGYMEGARLLQAAGRGLEAEALVKDWSIVVTAEISGRAALFAEGTDLNDEFEFEEHSLPLPPKEFLDIATCPECTMDALPESAVDVFTRLIPAVPTPPIPKLFGLRPLPDAINEAHRTNVTIPEIRVYSVIQAKVFGDSHIIRDDLVVSAPDIMPPYVRYFYNNGLVGVKSGKWPKERVTSGPVYLVTNFNTDQYGHFLLESLPRLFIAKLLYDDGFRFPILIPSTFPEFARRIATMLHKDFEFLEFEVQRDIILADRVLLPSMCHTDYIFHPCFLEFLRSLASDIIFTSKKAKLPDVSEVNRRRIFISRSRIRAGVSSFRAMQNYDEIETIARSRGFEIIHPQEMSWTEQVAMFANADFIVGEYGSGLHNALFARPGTCVLSINWLNGVQQHIARSCGHHIGFVLPDDNMPRSFSNDPSERQYFNVHPQHFSASLDNMLSENPLLVRV